MKKFVIGAALVMVLAGCGAEAPEESPPSKIPATTASVAAAPTPEPTDEGVLDMPAVESTFLISLSERLPKLLEADVTTEELLAVAYALCEPGMKGWPSVAAGVINNYISPVTVTDDEAVIFIEVAEMHFCGKSDFYQ